MAGDTADEVVGAGALEDDGGGAGAVGGEVVARRTRAVVGGCHLVHRVGARGVVEHCNHAMRMDAPRVNLN